MINKEFTTITIRKEVHPFLVQLSGQYKMQQVDIVSALVAHLVALDHDDRKMVLEQGGKFAAFISMGAKFTLDMNEEQMEKAILEILDDAEKTE